MKIVDKILGESTPQILSESDGSYKQISDITKALAARLNYFIPDDIEDCSDDDDYGENSCGYFRTVITDWMDYAKKLLQGNTRALKAIDHIRISLRDHLKYETSSCLYNIAEPWAEFLRKDGKLPQLLFDPHKGDLGLYTVIHGDGHDDTMDLAFSGDILNYDVNHPEVWDGSTYLNEL